MGGQVLRSIFTLPYSNALVFKGGTSLSKGWNLIERFSEDIDLAISPHFFGFKQVTTKKQRTKLRKDSKIFIYNSMTKDVKAKLSELGIDEDCEVIVPESSVSDLDPVVFL